MIYYIEDGKLHPGLTLPERTPDFRPCLCLFTPEEFREANLTLRLESRLISECLTPRASKFESHEELDFISLAIPFRADPVTLCQSVCIYFRNNLLVFVFADDPTADADASLHRRLERRLLATAEENYSLTLSRILQIFFDRLTADDSQILELYEEEATRLEEDLIRQSGGDYIGQIISSRKKLTAYKRFYFQLGAISSAIEENENDLLDDRELRYFAILTNRTERLLAGIENLGDYISQIREAYQTQVDIKQNEIMKLFTVITAIFLPLNLIVGWYGMNLRMPETHWPFGYAFVILLSLSVSIGGILWFKRKRWI